MADIKSSFTQFLYQGLDLNANQDDEPGDTEILHVDHAKGGNFSFLIKKTMKYWNASPKSIAASADSVKPECIFTIEWKNDNKVAIKANNGKYIGISSNGHLAPNIDNCSDENTLFALQMINKEIMVLQCDHGFIGGQDKILCNRGTHDIIYVENQNGKYSFKMANGKAWKFDDSGALSLASGSGDLFYLVLSGESKMKIKTKDGKFLTGDEKSGAITATGDESKAIAWQC